MIQKATWPDQKIVSGTLNDIAKKIREAGIKATAVIIVGKILMSKEFANTRLYDPDFRHGFRSGQEEIL